MLVVEDLHAGYGLSEVLHGTSLRVKAGTVVALIGANGAGKTTTMRAISGLVRPSKGNVLLEGKPLQDLPASRIARLALAHSPEGRKVFGPLSVEDNLLLGAYRRLPRFFGFRGEAARDLDRVYGLFPRLRERKRQAAGTLSGGEQQMLAIGRALMARPKVMLLDEPSMGLAPVIVQAGSRRRSSSCSLRSDRISRITICAVAAAGTAMMAPGSPMNSAMNRMESVVMRGLTCTVRRKIRGLNRLPSSCP